MKETTKLIYFVNQQCYGKLAFLIISTDDISYATVDMPKKEKWYIFSEKHIAFLKIVLERHGVHSFKKTFRKDNFLIVVTKNKGVQDARFEKNNS
ncbi:MAG TPA: hypothetical protein ENJ27_00065 [Candidatus Moranbacteria bacterium]|nr:hypothetical protein [Candidatus Moranbacteria bacterium]